MQSITNHEQWRALIHGERRTVFMFSAQTCPDCIYLEPVLPEIEKDFPDFDFYQVDRDEFIDDCLSLGVMGIPSFIVFEKGKEIGRFVSKFRKSKEEIENFLRSINGESV